MGHWPWVPSFKTSVDEWYVQSSPFRNGFSFFSPGHSIAHSLPISSKFKPSLKELPQNRGARCDPRLLASCGRCPSSGSSTMCSQAIERTTCFSGLVVWMAVTSAKPWNETITFVCIYVGKSSEASFSSGGAGVHSSTVWLGCLCFNWGWHRLYCDSCSPTLLEGFAY